MMKRRIVFGGGSRKGQLDLLPCLELGWSGGGFDVAVSFLFWYAYVEFWPRSASR